MITAPEMTSGWVGTAPQWNIGNESCGRRDISSVDDEQALSPRTRETLSPRTWWRLTALIFVVTAVLVLVLGWGATRGLSGSDLVTARFDAVKIALSVGAAGGATVGLYLAWRRQRSAEQVASDNRHDGEQRRVTELYAKAAEMLGAERAAVRMAGLYALERLAQDQPAQRRPVVSLLCAYLRMPYQDPDELQIRSENQSVVESNAHLRRERLEEVEVRYAVQALLRVHVHSGPEPGTAAAPEYWGDDLDVSLMGATLLNLNLHGRDFTPQRDLPMRPSSDRSILSTLPSADPPGSHRRRSRTR